VCKIKIELDKRKIAREKIYPYEKMLTSLDKICQDTSFIKESLGEYRLSDDADSVGSLLVLISRFESQSWLIPNIKSWTITDDDGQEEDALQTLMKVKSHGAIS
jgi:hypothetical protein